jgi:membrane protein
VAAALMFGRSQKVTEKPPTEKGVVEKPAGRSDRPEEEVDREVDRPMPDPDDSGKPKGPTDLDKRSWFYVLRKTMHEFSDDQCTDLAAALTYYSVLAIFPAALALVSILGVVGQSQKAVTTVVDTLKPLVSEQMLGTIEPALNQIASSNSAGLALVIGLAVALWSASGYVGAFGRAMNRIYEIREGRPFWKLRPLFLLLTLIAVVMTAVVLLMLIVSGPVAKAIGDAIGLGDTAVTVWQFAKWPVLLIVVVLIVALLYYATPNVKQPKFRWISVGALVAIIIWILASVGFAFYVANFSSYNKTYGSLAGVIVALLFLWITNLALLFGAELDSELERGRQLEAGLPAEEDLQLPARDTRNIKKQQKKEDKDIALGRKIRNQAQRNGTTNKEHGSEKEER